ncbi:MAG: HD-GYP domain-containing protein [Dehalococcoidia bacterium]
MPNGNDSYSFRDDALRDVRRLRQWIRAIVYPAVTLSGLIYHYGLGLSPLETLVPVGVGYAIATAAIEYAFAQMVRLRQQAVYEDVIHILSSALDVRDQVTEGHSRRVAKFSLVIARQLKISGDRLTDLERAAILHDIGKMAIADAILSKPGPLTEAEWQEMRKHPIVGYQIVRNVPFLDGAAEIILSHHERYDGGGYPRGLKGDEIPLEARIFAVADAYDAMTSDRPYRQARPPDYALEEIRRNMGRQFDPNAVAAFLAAQRQEVHV